MSNEIKTYLSEQKVDTLDNAAWLADDYSLTHKVIFVSKPHSQSILQTINSFNRMVIPVSLSLVLQVLVLQDVFFVFFAKRKVTLGLIVGLCKSHSLKRVSNLRV